MISIIMPVYNVEAYLNRCIDSIIVQTYNHFELLLIDDGSTDRSGTICDDYARQDARIRVFHTKNSGASSARNIGLDEYRGEYVVFFDSDDWIEPQMLEKLHNAIIASHADMAACDVYNVRILENGKYKRVCGKKWGDLKKDTVLQGEKAVYQIMFKSATLWNKMFSRLLIGTERFNTAMTYAEDTDFLFRILKKIKTCVFLPYIGYNYVYNRAGNVVSSLKTEKILEHIRNTEQLYDDMKAIHLGSLGVYRLYMVLNRHLCRINGNQITDKTNRILFARIHKAALYPAFSDILSFLTSGKYDSKVKLQYLLICISPCARVLYRKLKGKSADDVI